VPPVREAVTAYVALGANLGDPVAALARAVQAIGALPGTQLGQCSPVYLSAPIESTGPDYFNAVIEINTTLGAPLLLYELQNIEQKEGRERPWPNAPRTLDLDILLYGDGQITSARLTIPHPRMRDRAFVLRPLADIAPQWAVLATQPHLAAQRIERWADPLGPQAVPYASRHISNRVTGACSSRVT
jgi:2-amino-4-hydroxy-6-hydroxymethyldihydropteridine diphosphokinase